MPTSAASTFDIAFSLTGDARGNSRALRQLTALVERGLSVVLLTVGEGPVGVEGVHVVGRGEAITGGPRFYLRNHRALLRDSAPVHASVYHASDLYALPAMASAARERGSALTYDARECYPHVFGTVGKPLSRKFWQALEGRYVRRVTHAFTVSRSIASHMAQTYHVDPPTLLPNADPLSDLPSNRYLLHELLKLDRSANLVLYQGALTPHRELETLAAVWPRVAARCPAAHLVFLGDGPLRGTLLRSAGPERVHFPGAVPPSELTGLTASASVGVALLADVCLNHRYALPNKLFAYLSAGVPVVASDLPEMRRVLTDPSPAGLLVRPGDADDLARALVSLLSDAELRDRLAASAPAILETTDADGALHRFADTMAALAHRP